MANLSVAVDAFKGCFRSWRLWLIQFLVNPLLFGLFIAWLLIPMANAWHLVLNFLLVVFLLIAILVLHAGTLNYFYSQSRNEGMPLRKVFVCALENLFAVVLCAAALYLLCMVIGKAGAYKETLPAYFRSTWPVFLRRHAGLPFFEGIFSAILFGLRWILPLGLILPLLASASRFGFHGLARPGLTAWKATVFSFSYWSIIFLAALLGILSTEKIMGWTSDFRTSTLTWETTSLVVRTFVSYLLGLCAWMLACSAVRGQGGTFVGATGALGGQTGA
jgi:hypothetical protein